MLGITKKEERQYERHICKGNIWGLWKALRI